MPAAIQSCACTVHATATGFGVFASQDLDKGSVVLEIAGAIRAKPTRYSIQVGADEHVECDERLDDASMRARYPWRFLNHSCEPNAAIAGRTLVARRAIREGEQVTFDYTTTEARMAEPFACRCGARGCLGQVRGFLLLSSAEQRARAGSLAPHLRALVPAASRAGGRPA